MKFKRSILLSGKSVFRLPGWFGACGLLCLFIGSSLADGLPGEFLLSDQWRTLFKYHSPVTNPAFMVEQSYVSIRGVGSVATDEAAKLWEAGVTVPIGLYNAVGLTVLGENGREVSSVDGRIITDPDNVERRVYRNSNHLFILSYASNPWRKLSFGVNVNGAYQGNFGEEPSFGFGLDLGLSYRLLYHPFLGFHIAGLTFQNLIAPDLATQEKMPHSSQIKFYYHSAYFQNRFELDFQVDATDFMAKAETFVQGKKSEWDIFIQGGIWLLPFFAVKGFTEYGDSKKIDFWGAACELNIPQMNGGRDFSVLYQYRDEINSNLQGSHSVYFRADVGRNREELHARKIARMASLTANELYNKAMKLYFKGEFWNAYFIFQRILVEFPDFYKNDIVTYYAGSCMEELDLREEAIKLYQATKGHYSMSNAVPMADLGLMRVFYRQGQYSSVSNQFIELNRPGVPDSIRFHGCYLMGETDLRNTEYRKALQYFELVPEAHPAYVFAQHSSATAHALMNSGMHMVAANLENCIASAVTTDEQREIVNRSLVLLGYIFYEENTLSKAVSALRMVSPQSYYFEDALLGLGWTAIKARQWNDCILAGQQLAQTSKRFIMHAEAALIQAYGHILQKRYEQASILLKPIVDRVRDHQVLTDDSLATEKMRYESDRISYAFLGERATQAAQRGASNKQSEIDSMHAEQIRFKNKIDKYLVFADEFKRTSFFERTMHQVQEDLEYALATVQKIMNTSDYMKVREKMMNKDKAISGEIEKLREEMQKFELQPE